MSKIDLKAAAETLKRQLFATEIAAMLALRSKPDHVERVKDPHGGRYIVKAYGLTRADGGYVTVCFRCKGQADSYGFHRFEDWRERELIGGLFSVAAERIATVQHRLLHWRDNAAQTVVHR